MQHFARQAGWGPSSHRCLTRNLTHSRREINALFFLSLFLFRPAFSLCQEMLETGQKTSRLVVVCDLFPLVMICNI